jgi:hypothetical protein
LLVIPPIHTLASDLFGAVVDDCVDDANRAGDADVAKRGLSGDVSVDARAADDDDEDVVELIDLRKTRAGGNWLMGGILN